ncbi:hypothetical protein [Photobacterium damselae]|uniref:hypothetical protein n=1 Tax=Photobacterium damselae TaxID=38293 RepID=UPI001F1769A9|nr:hypothetical protein [Photobacterium damselae]UKA04519.1 hypothetical protein IHC89_23135 [Photobacterium damselae subsp. damselae]
MAILDVLGKHVLVTKFHALLNNSIDPQTTIEFDEWLSALEDGVKGGSVSSELVLELIESAKSCYESYDRALIDGTDPILVNNTSVGGDVRKMGLCKRVIELGLLL